MKKNKKSILGVTLVEILIGIVISSIMMAAMYASYTAVNNSFQKVTDKVKISQTGRVVLNMLVRDIRMAGFKYYAGSHEIAQYASNTLECNNGAGILLPKNSYLYFDNGFNKYVFNDETTYSSSRKYGLYDGTYTITNVPLAHPIAFLNTGRENEITYEVLDDPNTPI